MNIYEKVQKIKVELLETQLKKSGENKFAGFEYYELGDSLPQIIKLCDKHKVCTQVNFEENRASLIVVDSEDSNGFIEVSTPTEKLQIKGSNAKSKPWAECKPVCADIYTWQCLMLLKAICSMRCPEKKIQEVIAAMTADNRLRRLRWMGKN